MKYLAIIAFSILIFTCKAQNIETLNKEQYGVLSAFINQNFDYNDHFYLNKRVLQKEYPISFNESYNNLIDFYKKADSICNNSKDTLQLEFFCPAAFNRKKYVGLFDKSKLKYLKETYDKDITNGYIIDINKISKPYPIILEHSKEYYSRKDTLEIDNLQKESVKSKELPSLEIRGIYFSEDSNIALIEYIMTTETLKDKIQYSILKNEKEIWWRLIGNISRR